jgi:hypothetical protein
MKVLRKKLTQERLKEILHYNPDTGIFTWQKVFVKNQVRIGDIAGSLDYYGYIIIGINQQSYRAHRLVWFYVYGYFPEQEIDHINNYKSDNRLKNLREVSHQCNMRNIKILSTNTTGVTGVSPNNINKFKIWRARIEVDKKNKTLGSFKTFIEAVKCRWEAEKKYNWPSCNTTSSAYLYLKNKGAI